MSLVIGTFPWPSTRSPFHQTHANFGCGTQMRMRTPVEGTGNFRCVPDHASRRRAIVSKFVHPSDTNQQAAPAAAVDAAVAEAMLLAGDRTPDALALLRANVRLQCLYSNEYVAYIDWRIQ